VQALPSRRQRCAQDAGQLVDEFEAAADRRLDLDHSFGYIGDFAEAT
jgi:hypothetical protein